MGDSKVALIYNICVNCYNIIDSSLLNFYISDLHKSALQYKRVFT